MRHPTHSLLPAATLLLLSACGGGGPEDADVPAGSDDPPAATAAAAFPTGLAVGAPTDVAAAVSASGARFDGIRYAVDWSRAAWAALSAGDTGALPGLLTALMPFARAHADGVAGPEIAEKASLIEKVMAGDAGISLASVLDIADLFAGGGQNANCYGPRMPFADHQDGTPTTGELPSGDLGLWRATEDGATPCIAAQLSRRVDGVKRQTLQGLLMMATMRMTIAKSSTLSLPTAAGSVDLTSELASRMAPAFSGLPFTVTVESATVALDAGGTTYTYRLVLGNGVTGAGYKRGEVLMQHRPGADDATFSGVLRVAGFEHGNDAAFGCDDQKTNDTLYFKTARISSVKYSRSGSDVQFSSRASSYCGHPTDDSAADYGAQVASFADDGQLDPSVKINGSTRGSTLGWRGSFERFGADFDKNEITGNFLYAWQAGTGDSHSRALAATAALDSVSGDRTVKGYFGFAGEISATDGNLLGMVCNWAGPGNSHTPAALFQSQTAVMAAGAPGFAAGTNRITYAPTTSCTSTTTQYDANADGTLASAEGVGTVHDLDGPSGGASTVAEELTTRGWSKPSLF